MSQSNKSQTQIINEHPILLGFVVRQKIADGSVRIKVRWKRLTSACIALFATAWLGMAGALYLHFKYQKDFDTVSYVNMITLPFRLDAHRVQMGNYHIQRGIEAIKEEEFRDGFRLLRLGVARSPANLEGRRLVAEFYEVALNRPDIAIELLIAGLDHGGDSDLQYLSRTLSLLLHHQMDNKVRDLAIQLLPELVEITDINKTIAYAAANANHLRGNYDAADDYLNDYQLLNSLEGVLLSAQISWDRGNQLAAVEKLELTQRKYPNSDPLLMQLIRYYRERGDLDQARRYAILRNINNPLSYAPRVELLYIHEKAGDQERVNQEIDLILQLFNDNLKALQALANFAADTGNIEVSRKTYEKALENEFNIAEFALLLIEAHLVSGDFSGGLKFADELIKERPEWLSDHLAVFGSLRSIASYALDRPDLGDIYLRDFITDSSNKAETYVAVARRFEQVKRPQQARQILRAAYERNPNNQKILTQLLTIELKLGNTENLNELLSEFLQTRRPPNELLLSAYKKLASDRFIFTEGRDELLLQISSMLRENGKSILDLDS